MKIDDAYLGGKRSGGKSGRGSENKVPFIAAVQTTEAGHPVLACFAQAPFTRHAVEDFAARSLLRPLTVSILARLLHAACLSIPAPARVIRVAEVGR